MLKKSNKSKNVAFFCLPYRVGEGGKSPCAATAAGNLGVVDDDVWSMATGGAAGTVDVPTNCCAFSTNCSAAPGDGGGEHAPPCEEHVPVPPSTFCLLKGLNADSSPPTSWVLFPSSAACNQWITFSSAHCRSIFNCCRGVGFPITAMRLAGAFFTATTTTPLELSLTGLLLSRCSRSNRVSPGLTHTEAAPRACLGRWTEVHVLQPHVHDKYQ